jgi:surfeit locus 1 family protein
MGVLVDPLTGIMLFFVPLACLLIFIYSVGYSNFWAPRDPHDRTRLPAIESPAGEVRIEARIAPWPSHRIELAAAPEHGPIRQNLDAAQLARETGVSLRPLSLLQLGAAAPGDALEREWPVPSQDVWKHHGYALQWFALSALIAGLTVWYRLIRPRRGQGS